MNMAGEPRGAAAPKPDTDPKPPSPPAAAAKVPPAPAEQGAEPGDGKSPFVVTHRAGPRVAGVAVKPRQKIRLTEDEALTELLAGSIVREGEELHEQLRAGAKPRDPDASKAA